MSVLAPVPTNLVLPMPGCPYTIILMAREGVRLLIRGPAMLPPSDVRWSRGRRRPARDADVGGRPLYALL